MACVGRRTDEYGARIPSTARSTLSFTEFRAFRHVCKAWSARHQWPVARARAQIGRMAAEKIGTQERRLFRRFGRNRRIKRTEWIHDRQRKVRC